MSCWAQRTICLFQHLVFEEELITYCNRECSATSSVCFDAHLSSMDGYWTPTLWGEDTQDWSCLAALILFRRNLATYCRLARPAAHVIENLSLIQFGRASRKEPSEMHGIEKQETWADAFPKCNVEKPFAGGRLSTANSKWYFSKHKCTMHSSLRSYVHCPFGEETAKYLAQRGWEDPRDST